MRRKTERISDLQGRIALQIVEFIKDNDLAEGYHFTEEKFGDMFGVSRTPVRATLKYLERAGILRAEAHRGYFLATAPEEIDLDRLGIPLSDDERLYAAVVRDIARGRLESEITEIELIRRYKVQRGLVTRVLWRLAKEGVVERGPSVTWVVQPLLDSAEAVLESYRLRLLLEPAGLLEPTFKCDPRKLAKSREQHEALLRKGASAISRSEFYETNTAFHEMLAAMTGNRFLLQIVRRQNRLRRLMEYSARHIDRLTESCQEHMAIIDALAAGDRDWAAHLLQHHLRIAGKLYQEGFAAPAAAERAGAAP
ncbi:MAG: FCD domain-containing protein [Acetobacteraceae bacterium]